MAYPQVAFGCGGQGALLYVLPDTMKLWYAMSIFRLIRNVAGHVVVALVAIGCLMKIDWNVLKDQEWFSYTYDKVKDVVLPAGPPLVRSTASGAAVRESAHAEFSRGNENSLPIVGCP